MSSSSAVVLATNGQSSVASTTKFVDFCKVCDKIESKKSKNDKKAILKKFIDWWRRQSTHPDDCFYSALRLMCPHKDVKTYSIAAADEAVSITADNSIRSQSSTAGVDQNSGRSAYGLKVDKLRQKYIKILSLNRESDDAKKLMTFNKDPNNSLKDFANVLYEVMTRRSRVIDGSITLEEVNRELDRIARSFEENRASDADEVLTKLINNMTALENKWLVRIILKDMSLGIGDTSIMNAYHPDAIEYFDTIHNLQKVCTDLSDPTVPLSVKCIQLFSPFSPMLSERVKLKTINRLINDKLFFIELKYDGQRFQLHKSRQTFKYFSRNCNDFSDAFNQSLTPYIGHGFDDSVVDCILDGEMMAYQISTDRLLLQTEPNFDVKRLTDGTGDKHPYYVVFDVLYLNGKVMTGNPLAERIRLLESIIKPINTRLTIGERRLCETKEEIIDSMNAAIDRQEEGIIIKLSESVYKLNKRHGGGWLKLKPDYIDGLMDELDLLIIGGCYGDRGGVSHFLLGVKNNSDSDSDTPSKFLSVCRVGTGYTNEELRKLQNRFKDHWKTLDRKKCPQIFEFGRMKPDVWIEPKNSVILQVKAAEIMDSNGDYPNITFRFPRVMKIRDDKEWHQCMSVADMEQMRARGSLANTLDYEVNDEPEKKRKRVIDRPTISSLYQLADCSDVSVRRDLFADKEFCVIPFKDAPLKQKYERIIIENGGTVTASPAVNKTFCIIADNCDTIAVKRHVKCGKYDIVRHQWIDRCVSENKLLNWIPSDLWNQTNDTKNKMSESFDKYGDSYTEPIYELELRELFDKIVNIDLKPLSNKEIADIEFEYWPDERQSSFLRTVTIYVDNQHNNNHFNCQDIYIKYWQSVLRFYGATVVQSLATMPSHVVILNTKRREYFKKINRKNERKFHIVDENWIQRCIQMRDVCDYIDL